MDLSKVKLADSVKAGGKFFKIKTDFRTWICFSRILQDKNAVVDDADFVYSDEIPEKENKVEAFQRLLEFYSPKKDLPRNITKQDGEKVLDYDIDADLIFSAFYEQYKIDLLSTDKSGKLIELHWHKFLALLGGLHSTKLNEIMGYRCYKDDEKSDYKKQMQTLKEMWRLPTEADEKAQEDLDNFNKLFE